MINIVHVTSSLQRGGAELILSRLVDGLRIDAQQTVVYIHDGPYRSIIEGYGVRCIPISGFFFLYDPWIIVRLVRVLRLLTPDVLHTMLWAGNVLGRVAGSICRVPIVSVYHSNVDQDGWLKNICDRHTIGYASKLCAVSYGVADSIQQLLGTRSVRVIHNGIRVYHEQSPLSEPTPWPNDAYVIGAVGRLVGIKRFDLLIDAFVSVAHDHMHARLCIIGGGPEFLKLRKQVSMLGIEKKVHFLGEISAATHYHLFDCFVLPSPREGISMALLEAMRAGLPSIVICAQQHSVIAHGIDGIVLSKLDGQLLADALFQLIQDPIYAAKLGNAAQKKIKKEFNENSMIALYKGIFHAASKQRVARL